MTGLILAAAMTLSPTLLVSPETRSFGTEYYDTVVRGQFRERVLVAWPGPSGLKQLWESGTLTRGQKMTLLLGGASFHDPQLLPVYREALLGPNHRLRQAAAYGYRDLIGGAVPNVRGGVTPQTARALVGELDAVSRTVQRATLIDIWLASALADDGDPIQGWEGITFKKTSAQCLMAVESLANIEDLERIIRAYELSHNRSTRIALMRLIEGLSMNRFVVMPQGQNKGWGGRVYDEAFERLDRWLIQNCHPEADEVMENVFHELGVRGLDPMSPAACDAWLQILDRGPSSTWAVAADQVYRCGGPVSRLSLTRGESDANREARKQIKNWYGK